MRCTGRSVAGIVLVAAGLAGCSGADPAPVAAPAPAAVSTPAPAATTPAATTPAATTPAATTPAATTPAAPLTAAEERTLASLELLDRDHPLYEMTYAGALPPALPAAGTPAPPDPAATTGPSGLRKPFGCTVFLAGAPARPVVGRNSDWDPNPALVLHTDPPGGPATTSVVDISYLGYDRAHLADLDSPAGRRALLRAPLLPFDGMNSHGLAVGMAAEETAVASRRPGRAVVGSVRIMRLVLADVRQGHTQWSVAYDLRGRRAYLVVGQDYGTIRELGVG